MTNTTDKEQQESEEFFKHIATNIQKTEKSFLRKLCIVGGCFLAAAAVLVGHHTHALNTIYRGNENNGR